VISIARIRRVRRSRPAPTPAVASLPAPEPAVETDAEFLARLADEEAAEKARVLAAYHPLPEDVAEYEAWSRELEAGTLPPELGRFRFGCMAELDAIRSGQVSPDELGMLAAHGCI
jgi:hypothetical protein